MAVTATLGSVVFGGAADADGDRFTLRDMPGWTGAPVDLIRVERPLSAGAVIVRGRYTGRSLSIIGHGIATSMNTVWRVRNKLEACVTPTADWTLTVNEAGTSHALVVRLADSLQVRPAGLYAVEFEIPLFAANPVKT